ncbi:hypothetical protein ABI59_21535 [Acidobacteria bacterium Mor1]|nr:hypothetical protein ABI59_21535 [Acidobacteria bacterium Mor1]
MIEIPGGPSIPETELEFAASRSSGPGGQHANKVSSRMTLRWDVRNSPSVDDAQRARIEERLATRVTREGVLVMHAQKHRSQSANRELLLERFAEVLGTAFVRRKPRRRTRPSRASKERRLRDKKRRAEVKQGRGRYDG